MLFPFLVSLVGLFFLLVNSILFYRTRKNKSIQYFIITIYLICLFVEELFCNIIGFYNPGSNFFLSHYYFIFQFIALSMFFRNLFSNVVLKRGILFFLILVLILLAMQYYRKPDLYWEFNLFEIGVTSALLILYGLIFLIQNLKKNKSNYLYFTNGLVIYLISSLSIFLTGNTDSVIFTEPFLLDFWFFNSLFYILYQFLIFKEWKALTVKDRLRIPR
ncbi:hypothetical protein SAMN05444397_104159 [Flavobacterium aquidurense]|uniref:YhhN-like protein n=1 Tax=Flavobacterium frigidimaris TaxID=262320 RepID=A0ABX4BS69_FLAFR|nr:hypothetical protein B0A65_09350 [Flavobacterium frigidimaris]SDZ20815.1 hypothetical protein SAMN05444397_104159 [Flavobacterium aquidurense]